MGMVTEEKLVLQMVAKAIADTFFKQSSRIEFPSAALVFEFEKLACQMMRKGVMTVWVYIRQGNCSICTAQSRLVQGRQLDLDAAKTLVKDTPDKGGLVDCTLLKELLGLLLATMGTAVLVL